MWKQGLWGVHSRDHASGVRGGQETTPGRSGRARSMRKRGLGGDQPRQEKGAEERGAGPDGELHGCCAESWEEGQDQSPTGSAGGQVTVQIRYNYPGLQRGTRRFK